MRSVWINTRTSQNLYAEPIWRVDMYVHYYADQEVYFYIIHYMCVSYAKQKILANMLKARLVIPSLLLF